MSKRKLSQPTTANPSKRQKSTGSGSTEPADPEQSLVQYLYHAQKILLKALKLARTFEVQKLGRKVKPTKDDKGKPPTAEQIAAFDAQLTCLKALPLPPLTTYLLTHRLPKTPFLSPHLPALLSSLSKSASEDAEAKELDPQSVEFKARNRLFANKLVGEAWDEVRRAMGKRVGVEVEVKAAPTKVVETATSVAMEKPELEQPEDGKRLSKRAQRTEKARLKRLEPKPGMNEERKRLLERSLALEESDESGSEGEVDDDDEVRKELERLGGGGSDEEDSEEEEEDGFSADSEDNDSDSDSEDATISIPPPKSLPPAKLPKTAKASKPVPRATASTFLPTLSGTGYISYSDSDDDSARWVREEEKKDKKDGGRKNRRGQRARRAIWEQKYGSGANHVAKAAGTKPALSKSAKAKPVKPTAAPTTDSTPADATGVNSLPLVPRTKKVVRDARDVGEIMHPSWEAKRKQKELMEAALAGGGAGVGKKITFD